MIGEKNGRSSPTYYITTKINYHNNKNTMERVRATDKKETKPFQFARIEFEKDNKLYGKIVILIYSS